MAVFESVEMPCNTNTSDCYDHVESGEESADLGDSGEEWGFAGQINPHRDEPLEALADVGVCEDASMDEEEADADGLTPSVLEARDEKASIHLKSYYMLYLPNDCFDVNPEILRKNS